MVRVMAPGLHAQVGSNLPVSYVPESYLPESYRQLAPQ